MKWRQDISDPVIFGLYYGYQGFKTRAFSKYNWADWLNKKNKKYQDMYEDTSVDAYEWRAEHSQDPIFGYWWRKANDRDYYAERKQYEEDLKRNTGYGGWKDSAYPRTTFNTRFGSSPSGTSRTTPLFDVNDAILQLYNGVRKW